jgi:hypothetical protein
MWVQVISELQARPKSWMLTEASCGKLFPQTLPAQLSTAPVSGFNFHKMAARPTAPAPHHVDQIDMLASCSPTSWLQHSFVQ